MPSDPEFTAFELQALEHIAPQFIGHEAAFRRQVDAAAVIDWENTAVGFFTEVRINRSACPPVEFRQQGGTFEVEDVPEGVGVILWGQDGYLTTIEAYTFVGQPLEGVDLMTLKFVRLIE